MNADCMDADPIIGFTCDLPPGHGGDRHQARTWDGVPLASWPQDTHLLAPGYQLTSVAILPQETP